MYWGDFNLVKFPGERKVDGPWDSSMDKFGDFIDS